MARSDLRGRALLNHVLVCLFIHDRQRVRTNHSTRAISQLFIFPSADDRRELLGVTSPQGFAVVPRASARGPQESERLQGEADVERARRIGVGGGGGGERAGALEAERDARVAGV